MATSFAALLVGNPKNQPLVASLTTRLLAWADNPSCSPDSIANPYKSLRADAMVTDRLWNRIRAEVPAARAWVVFGCPVLVNPETKVVFAFGVALSYALRLPPDVWEEATKAGAKRALGVHKFSIDLSQLGVGWLHPKWETDKPHWWKRAYEYSAEEA